MKKMPFLKKAVTFFVFACLIVEGGRNNEARRY